MKHYNVKAMSIFPVPSQNITYTSFSRSFSTISDCKGNKATMNHTFIPGSKESDDL